MAEADDKLAQGKKLWQQAADAESDNRATAEDDIRFSRLEEQWPNDIVAQRQREGRPCLTIDKTKAFIRQVVNDARQNKPAVKVHPVDSGADPETAEVINGLIKNIEYISNADVAYDTGIECAVTGGFGYWRIKTDYAYKDSFDIDLLIERMPNPFAVYGDPNSKQADSSDWMDAFIVDRLNEAQWNAKYKDKSKASWNDADAWGDTPWRDGDEVMVAEWWHREETEETIYLTKDGMVLNDERMADEDVQTALGVRAIEIVQQRKAKTYKVTQYIMSGAEILEENEWPGCYIPIIPVYGDEFDVKGKRYFRSLIHPVKDSQRQFNYWETAATELVALAPKVPFIGPKGAFDHDIDRWNTVNSQSHPFLEYTGAQPPQRQPLDSGPAAGAMQQALMANDNMKAVLGIYDASLGARSNETSGKAIMARQREGDVSTFHFMDNRNRAIRHTGVVLIDLIPHFYNKARIIRVIGEDGKQKPAPINQPYPKTDEKTGQPIMQQQMGPQGEPIMAPVMAMHSLTAGKYDLVVSTGPNYTTQREEARESMTEVLRAFPQAAPIIGPMLAKNSDWPGADEIAEKLEAMADGKLPPQVEKMIEEGKAKIAELTEENAKLKGDKSLDQAELAMKAQQAQVEAQNKVQIAQIDIAAEERIAQLKIDSEERIATYKAQLQASVQAQANANRPQPQRAAQ
jgi:hypothetical protein